MLIAIVGATGTGKSRLSLDLAERLVQRGIGAEIVNADAMQLYRGMDVGTAKLSVDERRGIPHHLLDVLDPADEASVAGYQVRARAAIEEIQSRGAIPILVGGSGLYVSSVLWRFHFPGTDATIRSNLESELANLGPGILYSRLRDRDPEAASAIGPHNGRRLVRALEVIELTGAKFGAGLPDEHALWQPAAIFGVDTPRDVLVPRLEKRVARMWEDGLLDEVRRLDVARLGVTASRAIGYAQAIAHLAGEISRDDAIAQTSALTRKYARRQVSWFRRYPFALQLDSDDAGNVDHALDTMGL